MLNRSLEQTLQHAFDHALEFQHEFVTVEHLLLALLKNPEAKAVLDACDADLGALCRDIEAYLKESVPVRLEGSDDKHETQPTLGFQRVLQRAALHVQSSGQREVTGANVLVSIFSERESYAVYFLSRYQLSRLTVVSHLGHGKAAEQEDEADGNGNEKGEKESKFALLENLNLKAREGHIDPLIGRQYELQRVCQVLCRRQKNNPLLVGDPGVGKTAIAEGLAWLIEQGKVPEALRDCTLFALDMGSLLSGTKYRGDFERRIKQVLKQLREHANSILFIDEVHMLIGAGAVGGSAMDASNLLKPMLASGLRCMGSTTYTEYRRIFEKDHALVRRFQKVDVPEPSPADALQILRGLKGRYEAHHEIRYTQKALEAAVALSVRHLHERFLPDKAIDLIDEAGAAQRLLPASRRRRKIREHEIEQVLMTIARVPEQSLKRSDTERLQRLEGQLKRQVLGQDDAVDSLVTAVKVSCAGLNLDDRPRGCFLFAGPTGVGKTELARQLANALGVKLLRFDMSEYAERHTISRLIGSPPGYVGHESGGLLTEQINQHPHSVLLLDEMEKAHPDIYNLMLQVMDHGCLTDNSGRIARFEHCIVIMTTNVGADSLSRPVIGFTGQSDISDRDEAVRRAFSPEFRNRLDAIIQFAALEQDQVLRIVDKFLLQLEQQLHDHKVTLDVTVAAKQWLVTHGFDSRMGARNMHRMIHQHIKKPLAELLLFGDLKDGGVVQIGCQRDALQLRCKKDS